MTVDDVDRDVLGLYREGDLAELAILYVRAGKLADVSTLSVKGTEIPDEEIVGAFLTQHYAGEAARRQRGRDGSRLPTARDPRGRLTGKARSRTPSDVHPVPDEVILPCSPKGAGRDRVARRARRAQGDADRVRSAGRSVDLLAMANDNARHAFRRSGARSTM